MSLEIRTFGNMSEEILLDISAMKDAQVPKEIAIWFSDLLLTL